MNSMSMCYRTESNVSYTEEFRKSSAKLAYESDQPVSKTAENLGVHETTLYGWIAKYYPKRSKRQKIGQADDPYEELKQLKRVCRYLVIDFNHPWLKSTR